MKHPFTTAAAAFAFLIATPGQGAESASPVTGQSIETNAAVIRVHSGARSPYRIPRFITGKFAEHLGFNIYNGMDAQILHNPTFAEYPFWNGQMTPDGVTEFLVDASLIKAELRRQATRFGWPESELDDLVQARNDGLACFWTRVGDKRAAEISPDTGPAGGRAQRVRTSGAGQGLAQWTWLPLHRTREYEVEVLARSAAVQSLSVSIWAPGREQSAASVRLKGISGDWRTVHGKFVLPSDLPADASYRLAITTDGPGEFVIAHAFLKPADHVNGADPDIVRLLKESRLPLLRWPGGNFVSTYHWQDGVGPVESRPTLPNLAWGGVEPNTFGTDEFIAFCRAVGCEPMICFNGGSGTPEEAARWIEYCNGAVNTPMGALRAANGHPEPFHVRLWEIGNELWGHWQMRWTTAHGYADRYQRFAKAALAADPTIQVFGCGAPAMSGKEWNDTLIAELGNSMPRITDHPLIGGTVSATNAPLDVYRDFMAVPDVLQGKWSELREAMRNGHIADPKLAVTELQLFAHLGPAKGSNDVIRLAPEQFPSQGSMTEAVYDVLIYHAAVRLLPFVEWVTHSAVVNHGGGLRKERERVWANPCHYAQAAFSALADTTPVAVEITSPVELAPMVLPDLRRATKSASFNIVDAVAAIAPNGSLLLSVVHRGSSGPVRLKTILDDFQPADRAEVRTLTADRPWDSNTRQEPERIHPIDSVVPVQDGSLELELRPFSVLRVRVPAR